MAKRTYMSGALSLSLILISHASAQTIATLKSGDSVSITGTLTTNDPNENGEGEPAIITANGGQIGAISGYAIPTTFNYTASGPTTISYFIAGADGDEQASFSATINPNTSLFSPAVKQRFAVAAATAGTTSGLFWTIDAICGTATAGICAIAGTPIAAITSFSAGALALGAADPIDPNYKVIATPNIVTLPGIFGITQTLANDEAAAIGYSDAMQTSVNRYQGASAAGDTFWITAQSNAATTYEQDFSMEIGNISSDLKGLGITLSNSGATPFVLSTNDVLGAEVQLASAGLPQSDITFLEGTLGLTVPQVAQTTQLIYVQNINDVAGDVGKKLSSGLGVPEPSVWAEFIFGFLVIGTALRRSGPRLQRDVSVKGAVLAG